MSSLERVELMVALEDAFQTHIDEGAFCRRPRRRRSCATLVERRADERRAALSSRSTSRRGIDRCRRASSAASTCPTWILPLARVFAWLRVEGREHLQAIDGPVIFAANHQSHMDAPGDHGGAAGALALPRRAGDGQGVFQGAFLPRRSTGACARFTNSLNYYLAALVFNAFPLPQREAGARQTLRYIGELLEDGYSVLIFPEGRRTEAGEIDRFRPGIGMIASRLGVPVVPVRLEGLDQRAAPYLADGASRAACGSHSARR